MKRISVLIGFLIIILTSCKKENTTSLISKYQSLPGSWDLQSVSYDSASIKVTKTTRYNRLIINSSLEYQINMDLVNPVENGTISIIEQTNNKLVLYFAAVYPAYSSYTGSHIFGISNAILISISNDEMIYKSAYTGLYNNLQFHFKKL